MAQKNSPVIIVGGGLAGLVAAFELSKRKVHTIIIDQENEASLGGQAFWSLGGLFCVNSADQRRLGIQDSRKLAMEDWFNSARFDRECDLWPRKWAEAFVNFATDHMERYVKSLGVPRFHVSWGTGPAIVEAFEKPVRAAAKKGLVEFMFRHQVDSLIVDETTGAVIGVRGQVLEPSDTARGVASNRKSTDTFEVYGSAVLIASGGIGGNVDLVKKNWPVDRLGTPPSNFVIGVPAHVDGRMIEIAKDAGANVINEDRMWHYTEGLQNWDPIWPQHGIRIIPGPSSLWLDATGKRLPPMLYPGCDTLATLKHICNTGYDYTWFVLDKTIIGKEFALSGSEQNPDLTGKSRLRTLYRILGSAVPGPVQAFMDKGVDFVVEATVPQLVAGMNKLAKERGGPPLDVEKIEHEIHLRDMQIDNKFTKDAQIMLIQNGRNYWPDRFGRVAKPHKLADPSHGPFVAVRLNLLTRKTLGGLETDLHGRVLRPDGSPFPSLYAAGEVSGFGGGGVHGYSALEGTFLGGCIFSGRTADKTIYVTMNSNSPPTQVLPSITPDPNCIGHIKPSMNPLLRSSARLYSTMSATLSPTSSPFTKAVVSSMRKLYPETLADKSWDNTGLLLEAPFNPTRRQKNSVLLAIDLTKAVADEAIARKDSAIVAYHPIIFRGLKSLTFTDPQQQSLLRLAQEGISVYSPHTAVDATPGGMADWLCDIVTGSITPSPSPSSTNNAPIQSSSSKTYSAPSYPTPHAVVPAEASSIPKHTRTTIHPSPPPLPENMETAGMGRLVTFDSPQPLTSLVDRIADGVGFPGGIPIAIPQGVSVDEISIRTVGVCPGSGSSVLMKGGNVPDLLFTGEMSHHEALAAIERGKVVVALAHSNTERGYLRAVMREKLEGVLKKEWEIQRAEALKAVDGGEEGFVDVLKDGACEVHVSESDRDPYGIMVRRV
ncbi:FAD binding domain-containing protein [Aspergillus caelatus]|uniref:FAD binding domain-containing protein n=1 Tax=Aspergillus caelatus TaxID=61420 RepID=A0A5N7A682_9EURO|nr:FAD binding domain-containing protein [Aspergillus caelatus]KAE8365342.1 FAD binding domain-containing protein [Aspergillus caelatus]